MAALPVEWQALPQGAHQDALLAQFQDEDEAACLGLRQYQFVAHDQEQEQLQFQGAE
jgi:hypothetical protein